MKKSTEVQQIAVKFSDIFVLEEIQHMQDLFSDATGVASIITLPDGTPITKPANFTRLCNDIVRKTDIGCANCIKSDAQIGGKNIPGIQANKCLSAGLWDAGVGINIGGKHIANWLIGQVQTDDVDIDKMKAYADEIGADRAEFLSALAEVPKMTEAQFRNVVNMLFVFAQDLSDKAYKNLQLKREIAEREKATLLLQKSEESLYITLHSIGDGVITTDKDGAVQDMNPVAEQLCGWKLKEAEGKQLTDVFHIINAETREKVANPVNKVLENGQIVGLANHTILISRQGIEYQIADSAAPIKCKEGNITGVVLVFSNVTAKYKAEEVQRQSDIRYRELLNHLEAGVVVHAPDTSILTSNPRASELLGLSAMQMSGKTAMHSEWKFLAENNTALALEDYPVNIIVRTKKSVVDYVIGINRPVTNDIVWVLVNGFPMLDAKGEIIEIVNSFIDITHRKNTEDVLIKSREDFKELYENAPVGYHELDNDGRIIRINHTELNLLGYTYDELVGRYGWEVVADKEFSRNNVLGKLAGIILPVDNIEREFIRKDGTAAIFLVKDKILKDSNGVITGIRSTVQDITKWKQTEFALLESEKKHSLLFTQSPDAYLTIVDGVFVDCNQAAERMMRGTRDQIIGQSPISISPEFQMNGQNTSEAAKNKIEQAFQHGENTFDWVHRRFDGSEFYVEVSLVSMMLEGKPTLFATWRDISQRKLAEEALENERLLLRTLIDNMPDAIYSKDLDCRKTLSNRADAKNSGFNTELEVLGKNDFDVFPKDIAEKFFSDDQSVLQSGKPVLNREEYVIDAKGEKRWLLTSKLPLFNKDNQIVGLVGIGRDITIRRNAEQTLLESLSFLKETQMIAHLGTYTLDIIGNKWVSSEMLDNIFGIESDFDKSLDGWVSINHPDWQKIMLDYFVNEVVGLKSRFDKEYKIIRQNDKAERWVHGIGELVFDSANRPIKMIGTIKDITELKTIGIALEKQLEFQSLLMNISTEYINLPLDKIESSIDVSLCNLAKFVGADRAYIFDYDFEKQISTNTYEWCADGVAPQITNLQTVPMDQMQDWPITHSSGTAISIPDVATMAHGDVKTHLESQGIKSLLTVPMMLNEKCIGFVGFDSVKQHQFYSSIEKSLLMTFAEILVNIQLRKKADETIQNERLLLRTVIDNIPDTIYAKDLNLNKTLANKAELQLLGATTEQEVVGKRDDSFYDDTFATNFMADDIKILQSGEADYNREGFIIDKEGKKHWLLSSKLPLRNKDNQIIGLVGIGHDITNRRQAEEALRNSEEKYRTIFENVQDVFYQVDISGTIIEISPSIKYFSEFNREQLLGSSVNSIYSNTEERQLLMNELLKHGDIRDYELSIQTSKGLMKQVSINARVNLDINGNPTHIDGAIRDISKRKKAEEALQASESFLKETQIIAQLGTYSIDFKSATWTCSEVLDTIFGIEALYDKTMEGWNSILHPESEIQLRNFFFTDIYQSNTHFDSKFKIIRQNDKSERWVHGLGQIVLNEMNEPVKMIGTIQDITERKLLSDELHKSEALYRTILNTSPDTIVITDLDGIVQLVSPAALTFYGYSHESELIGRNLFEFVYFKDLDRAKNNTLLMLKGEYKGIEEFRMLRADGTNFYTEINGEVIREEDGQPTSFIFIIRDISKRKEIDKALINSQEELKKFAAHLQNVREEERIMLAREIHDELGQILIAIKIDTGLLKLKVLKEVDNSNYSEILTKFDSLSGLVDNTIGTTRKIMTDLRPEVLYLLGFMEAVKLQVSQFQQRHKIICHFESEIIKLELSQQQSVALYRIVQETLNNIVKHAKATEVHINIRPSEHHLILEIRDNGTGFDQNHKVKADSYGMIGMKERVFLLAGELFITSTLGKGTIVKVKMPYVNPNL